MQNNKIYIGIIALLVLLLIGTGIKGEWDKKALLKEIRKGNEKIVNMSKTIKEKDGQYAKLVDYFETSRSLMKFLKESNKDLAKQIRKSNEKLLQVSNIVATFEEKLDEGTLAQENDSTFKMDLFYPDKEDWFINWDGRILAQEDSYSYSGKWKFGNLNLQAVLTETERGLWNARLIGPDFLQVDSIEVKSLAPEEYKPQETKNLQFLIGGGYTKSFDPSYPSYVTVGGGIQWKNRSVIQIVAGTNNSVGAQYYYKFQGIKR